MPKPNDGLTPVQRIEHRLDLYDKLAKTRPLLPHEEERVIYLAKRLKQAQYRETPAGKAATRRAAKKQREQNRDRVRANFARWYAKHPEQSEKAVARVQKMRNRRYAEAGKNIEDLEQCT